MAVRQLAAPCALWRSLAAALAPVQRWHQSSAGMLPTCAAVTQALTERRPASYHSGAQVHGPIVGREPAQPRGVQPAAVREAATREATSAQACRRHCRKPAGADPGAAVRLVLLRGGKP